MLLKNFSIGIIQYIFSFLILKCGDQKNVFICFVFHLVSVGDTKRKNINWKGGSKNCEYIIVLRTFFQRGQHSCLSFFPNRWSLHVSQQISRSTRMCQQRFELWSRTWCINVWYSTENVIGHPEH